MYTEQTFIGSVCSSGEISSDRDAAMLITREILAKLEYMLLLLAVTLFCFLVVMHVSYVQQPGCSSEFARVDMSAAQVIMIKITSSGLWSQNETSLRYDNRTATSKWREMGSNAFEPTYIYTLEKGYILLLEEARSRHNLRTMNISISAQHNCFGNWLQQLLINRLVGYETILMNSLLNTPGKGYLYNYQTKELYNLSNAHEKPESSAKFGDYIVTKCGVLLMSLFVLSTTTTSVSFTLRETQARMLKFTVQLQYHARNRLPTFQLIFAHVVESLVFVPAMIGLLFFLFEFYDEQLLAFTVLILVWISELFKLISVRTPISMKFFPQFFLLYLLLFHIYIFSYNHGFSYLALATCSAFTQHLILYFWNRFEVPGLQ